MDAVGDDHKLFTAKPICKIGHPRSRHDIEHDALEHLVPGSMAEAVVICLEVIDIDQQQGQWPPSGGGMLDSAAAVGFQRIDGSRAPVSASQPVRASATAAIFAIQPPTRTSVPAPVSICRPAKNAT